MTHIFDVKNVALASAFAGALLLAPALAASAPVVGDVLGTDEATIRTSLEAQGYVIDEFEKEDGEIEVEVAMNDTELEIKIDAETGAVLEIDSDDDVDSDMDTDNDD
ncbi:MAG: PepSY domain-containing protein [Hyphomicrobiales bacterium]